MGNANTGGKAGAVAGVAYGIIAAVFAYVSFEQIKSTILPMIAKALPANSPITTSEAYSIFLVENAIIVFVLGVIIGVILGAIYGALFERIPGKTGLTKAVVLGLIFWLLDGVLVGLAYLNYGTLFYAERVVVGLAPALIFAYLLAALYIRYSPQPRGPQAPAIEPQPHGGE